MATGTAILIVWLALLAGCMAMGVLLAYTRFGVFLLTRQSAAEVAVAVSAFAGILYGVPLAAAMLGIVP